MEEKKPRDKASAPPKKKVYLPPQLNTEKVFSVDALGGCRMTSVADGCGRGRGLYLSAT